jgi:AraC-like DNA-binding protein
MMKPICFSTADVPENERAPIWREWLWQRFDGLETDLYGALKFNGAIQTFTAGPVTMTKLSAGAHRVVRSAAMVRKSNGRFLKIVAPWSGCAVVEQNGRRAEIRPGEWSIYDTGNAYEINNPAAVDHLVVMLPDERFADRSLRLADLMARPVAADGGIARLALEAMRTTFLEIPSLSVRSIQGTSDLISHLVFLTLLDLSGHETALSQLASLRSRAQAYIQRHLRDAELTVTSVAVAMNCSRRHLYNAFSDDPDTLAGYILRERIQACTKEIRDPNNACRTITDIAVSWGFTNMSHFSRVFRESTGVTASEYRTRQSNANEGHSA